LPRLPARLLLVALCTALTLVGSAQAEVTREAGYSATVDGYRGWFGSYQMAQLGTMWCVDHGLPPPDPGHGYRPVELTDHPAHVRRAMAWALARHGHDADRVAAAALMLVLHDLAGQRYPGGRLELERLGAERLDGFEGAGPLVLARARAMKSDALAHSRHEGPFRLTVESAAVRAGETGTMVARLTDRAGAGVAGISLHASSAPRRDRKSTRLNSSHNR
jgi:hypothetical protein